MSDKWDKDRVMSMADNRIITYSGKTLCGNYRNPLERCRTAAQAIRLYKNCISWALQERYPTKEDLLSFADRETLAENGVYIDMNFDGERIDGHVCCVFLNCTGKIRTGLNVEKRIIPMLYLSEGSSLEIGTDSTCRPGTIPVELYYGSSLTGYIPGSLAVYDYNGLTAKDNKGFDKTGAEMEPDIDNEYL